MAALDRLTVKAGQALEAASRSAGDAGHPEVSGAHLLQALLEQEGGIVGPVLEKAGLRVSLLQGRVADALARDIPTSLVDKRLVQLDISAMLAGAKYRGEFEDRMKAVLKEITESEGRFVVFIDEMHTIVGAGAAEGAVDAGNMLKPMLARGELRLVGATTLDEYRKHVEKDPALERRFQPVFVAPSSVEDAIAILRGLKERYEVHHGVRIRDEALIAAAKLSDRYIGGRFLPDKAIDLMDEAASRLRIEIESLPEEIDEFERRITQLEIERQALAREEDRSALERREAIEEELAGLREKSSGMKAKWQAEKDVISRIQASKERIDELKSEAERATRVGDLERAAQLQYGEIPRAQSEVAIQDTVMVTSAADPPRAVGGRPVRSASGGAPGRREVPERGGLGGRHCGGGGGVDRHSGLAPDGV